MRVTLDERVSPDIVRAVPEGAAEVGVLSDASEVDGLHNTPYRRDRRCVVMQATHPLARHNRLSFEKAIDHITVGVAPGAMLDTRLRREAARLSTTMAQRVQVSGMDMAVRIAAAGCALRSCHARRRTAMPAPVPWYSCRSPTTGPNAGS